MCRLCGRMIKCIFDSMPSRVPTSVSKPTSSLRQPHQTRSHHVSSRTLVQSALNIPRKPVAVAPPTFLLPFRAKLHQTRTQPSTTTPVSQFQNTQPEIPPSYLSAGPTQSPSPSTPAPTTTTMTTISPSTTQSLDRPLVVSRSLQTLLPKLHAQKPHYMVAHIHRFPYLLTEGDMLRLPFHMKGVSPGDILRFNRASILGSRDYTLKAGTSSTESYDARRTGEPQYLDERLFECRVRVMGIETQPMTLKEKKKRRNRHRKIVKSKHKYTLCRVMQVRVKALDELLQGEKGMVLLEGQEKEE
ncbi:uncharacterized protein Z520_09600 [Fonsecaea multimorphosa CBS 102226]|uniref:Uncharacterized protein n=1 Tax=Fonsecaea multimorphosa CBS 102226 TaxID=1442371 RepID=A0A0D2JVL8_9EURO|nr:uncharacterized protein Z520_09600 [Fonsecaea multimorphosa CBS 102226]KIX94554.1 hypothetical protein Z520_09600 [Fonsecaea multimorphosa CBS 102226]OAL20265.1 hypothetical protein AYO22_08977 [Fonsecaea multimorphosa]